MLTFVIPVRHQASVEDWSIVRTHLAGTVQSIAAQTDPDWEAVVVANDAADLPDMPERVRIERVGFPYQPLPPKDDDTEAYYEAVRLDKGRRILAGLLAARPKGHVMVVDYDDLVSNRLSELCKSSKNSNGWYFSSGYVYSGGSLLIYRPEEFFDICGTSHIIRADLLDLPESMDAASDVYVRRMLGSHKFIRDDLLEAGHPMSRLPFPGAIYRVGHPGATSGSKALFKQILNRRSAFNPSLLLRNLTHCRRVSGPMQREFFAGGKVS